MTWRNLLRWLNVWKINILKFFSGGVGCFKGTIHIDINKDAEPYQAPPRQVPIALQKPFKTELDRMIKLGIIEPLKIDKCSKWCNSYVTVQKPSGDMWMYIDPAKLNCVIVRPIHTSQTVSDVLSRLSGATYFSLLDATSGFWNCELDKESSKLTTFATPYGRYRFKHLPFGLSCAGNLFQAEIEIFSDMRDVAQGIAGKHLSCRFWEEMESDHDAALEAVCACANEVNICLNDKRCIFHCTIAPFFGELVSRKGVKPDLRKLEAI